MHDKPMKVVFMPGCFDNFEGTQSELDELIAQINELAASGDIQANATLEDEFDFLDEHDAQSVSNPNIRH